jgi:hypothetical protein
MGNDFFEYDFKSTGNKSKNKWDYIKLNLMHNKENS